MTHTPKVRLATAADITELANIADQSLFPGEMLSDMIAPFLDRQADAIWATAEIAGNSVGFVFAEPEPMTDGTWNIKAIAVSEHARGLGAGRALLSFVESNTKARLIVIDTTQLEDQKAGRSLYAASGYTQVSVIPDFWEPGVDKVTFAKTTA